MAQNPESNLTRRIVRQVILWGLTSLTFASVLLWILPYAMIVPDYQATDEVLGIVITLYEGPSSTWILGATDLDGQLTLQRLKPVNERLPIVERFHGFGRFEFHEWAWGDPQAGRFLSTSYNVPLWFPPLFFGLYPFLTLLRGPVRRSRRRRRGLCVKCGYNLAGNITGVCPECGTRATLILHQGNENVE